MFFRLGKQPAAPLYSNAGAENGKAGKGKKDLRPWEPGLEIVLYNSRNFYTDGSPWKFTPEEGIPWLPGTPADFVPFNHWMVLKKADARMVWSGWVKPWDSDSGSVRAKELMIHKDEVLCMEGWIRRGKTFKTKNIANAERLFVDGRIGAVGWAGDSVEVSFKGEPSREELALVGWKRMPGGDIVETACTLGDETVGRDLVFPGHDPAGWRGVAEVSIHASGKEGCLPSSFVVDSPEDAERLMRGLGSIPSGCRVTVVRSWNWYRRFSSKDAEGSVCFDSRHLPPLKPGIPKVSLLLDRGAGGRKSFLLKPENIDFGRSFRPVVGSYYGKNGEEKCLVSTSLHFMRHGSVASRSRLTHLASGKGYRVISPGQKGGIVSRQKMYGKAAVDRLPENKPEEMKRLVSLYGDVVPFNYYDYAEEEYRSRALSRDKLLSDGFYPLEVAIKKSAVPESVYRSLSEKGLVQSEEAYEGAPYYRPVVGEDFEKNPDISRHVVDYAVKNDIVWLCQLASRHSLMFKRAMIEATFAQ